MHVVNENLVQKQAFKEVPILHTEGTAVYA